MTTVSAALRSGFWPLVVCYVDSNPSGSTMQRETERVSTQTGDVIHHFALLRRLYPYRISADRDRIGGDHFVRKHMATH
jgi:hypothetical protein